MTECGIPDDRRTSSLKRSERLALIDALTAYPLPWSGHEGYKKAEVTGGGVALSEVNPVSMESRRQPGLYICGEVLDAFGDQVKRAAEDLCPHPWRGACADRYPALYSSESVIA